MAHPANWPSEIDVRLTDRCNLNCAMCGQSNRRRGETDDVNLLTAIERATQKMDLTGVDVYLWGGEPLLREDVFEFVRYYSSKGAFVMLNTNGTLLPDRTDELVETPPSMLIVSLDGTGPANDGIRGLAGAYDLVMRGLSDLCSRRPRGMKELGVHFTIWGDNYRTLPDLCVRLRRLPVDWLEVSLPMFMTPELSDRHGIEMLSRRGIAARSHLNFVKEPNVPDIDALAEIVSGLRRSSSGFVRTVECHLKLTHLCQEN
jgi:MoaA/NifB/PqqE/SkfB family radical SAM enzyme